MKLRLIIAYSLLHLYAAPIIESYKIIRPDKSLNSCG